MTMPILRTLGLAAGAALLLSFALPAAAQDCATYLQQVEAALQTANVSGEADEATIPFTDGADMDNLADGEFFILRIFRNGDDVADDMSNDAELWYKGLVIRET